MKSSDYKNERIRNINTSNIEKITRGGLKKFISDIALEKATSDNDINQEQYVIDNTDSSYFGNMTRGKPPKSVPELGESKNTGDIINITNIEGDLITFIRWQNGKHDHVDLDLSVIGLDEYGNNVDSLYYGNMWDSSFNGTMDHSGDITNAPTPASEYIIFNLDNFKNKNPKIRRLVVVVQSYNQIPFDDMGEALVGIGLIPKDESVGLGPKGSHMIMSYGLNGNHKQTIAGVLNFTETSTYFQCYGINGDTKKKGCLNINTQSEWLHDTLTNFELWCKSSSAPPKKILIELINAASSNYVKYLGPEDEEIIFEKQDSESNVDFFNRMEEEVMDSKDLIYIDLENYL